MATTYKTPGVYVEEIPKLPPSVAQVETAIPAFVGYTEKAEKNGESLIGKGQAIESLAEYTAYFGEGPAATYQTYLDSTDTVTSVKSTAPYLLYDGLKLFYDNGGGRCYIFSVGTYKSDGTVDPDELNKALGVVEKYDEPTIIVSPDAVLLSGNGLYDFQKLALALCEKLQDRVLLCDTLPSDENVANQTFDDRVQQFRDGIGISNLKYGAAYAPYLVSSLSKKIYYRDIVLRRGIPTSYTDLSIDALNSDNDIAQLILDLKGAKTSVDNLSAVISTAAPGILTGTSKTFEDQYKNLLDAYVTASGTAAKTTAVKAIYAFTLKMLAALQDIKVGLPTKVSSIPVPASSAESVNFILKDDISGIVTTTSAKTILETLIKHSNAFGEGTQANELMPDDPADITKDLYKALQLVGITATAAAVDALTEASIEALYDDPVTDDQKNEEAKKIISSSSPGLIKLFYAVQSAAATYEKTFDGSLETAMGTYKQIKNKISSSSSVLPPSTAIAGIFARVDNARGVWKAPANESINSVSGTVFQVTADKQESLNIDPVAGKSINAIRTFTGRGSAIVWGARTLSGNDNEWRYISVRRFFNMVEESCKKSTEPFVFESNDANTWVKIQGMIENFLTTLWRQGALQGAKPEHAFYVAVGLGKTMTALDILEGRLIVEIGMAVVRPAEFIILRFSHKMAES
jgi:phage tail sheath protein FI